MRDFQNWLRWYQESVDPQVDVDLAQRCYDEYYSCNCETCTYNKEMGHAPFRLRHGCTAPWSPAGLKELVLERTLQQRAEFHLKLATARGDALSLEYARGWRDAMLARIQLVGRRTPTEAEIEYGKSLEPVTKQILGESNDLTK